MSSRSSKRMPTAPRSQRISPDEIQQLCKAIEDAKTDKKLILIVLCQSQNSVNSLEDTYKSGWVLKRSYKRIVPTTLKHLEEAMSWACTLAKRKQRLMLLVSPYVASISFHIPRKFHMVTVYRCGDLPRENRGKNGEDQVLIQDSSTFCNFRLRQWEDRPQNLKNRRLCLLGNVYLELDFNDMDGYDNLPCLSTDDKNKFIYAMRGLQLPSSTDESSSSFWDKWKAAIAILIGGLAGVAKFEAGIKLTGAGLYCSHWFGLKIFGGYLSTSAYVAAAAPAVAVAFGTAAAVYFVPWGALWDYFKRLLGSLWQALSGICEWIKEKLSSLRGVVEEFPSYPPSYRTTDSF